LGIRVVWNGVGWVGCGVGGVGWVGVVARKNL